MKRSWLARHPVGFMALYSIFYLSVFHYLESNAPCAAFWCTAVWTI